MDGCQSQQVVVQSVLGGTFAANLLLGGIIGGVVDFASGAAYRLVPETVTVTLRELQEGEKVAVLSETELTPQERLRNLEKLHRDGLITDDEYKAMRKIILDDM